MPKAKIKKSAGIEEMPVGNKKTGFFDGFLDVWKQVLMKPAETFKREKKNADLGEGAKHILIAGVIVGVLSVIQNAMLGTRISAMLGGTSGTVYTLVATPVMTLVGWLIGAGVLLLVAKMLGGKGSFNTQAWLTALYLAPVSVLAAVLALIPFVGSGLGILVWLYGLYLLTLALCETHEYGMSKAALTWLLPVIVVFVLVASLAATLIRSFGLASLMG